MDRTQPNPVLARMFRLPALLYRFGLGWLLGKRFLALTHRGRKSGRLYRTVLEVISYEPDTRESIVVSAYGEGADWYRNLQTEPALRVQTGRLDYTPHQRFIDSSERARVAGIFCEEHPWEARLIPRVLPAIGAAIDPVEETEAVSPPELLSSLPMVGLRPSG